MNDRIASLIVFGCSLGPNETHASHAIHFSAISCHDWTVSPRSAATTMTLNVPHLAHASHMRNVQRIFSNDCMDRQIVIRLQAGQNNMPQREALWCFSSGMPCRAPPLGASSGTQPARCQSLGPKAFFSSCLSLNAVPRLREGRL